MSTKGKVKGIISNLVTVEVDGPVAQNEIAYIELGSQKLMAEVLKVIGDKAFVQVFESTRGLKVGNNVEFMGHMLEVTLGPGLLSRNYDGLQNDLDKLTGVFCNAENTTIRSTPKNSGISNPLPKRVIKWKPVYGWAKWTKTINRTKSWFLLNWKERSP